VSTRYAQSKQVGILALLKARRIGDRPMTDVLKWHRIQFVFTITNHYLFPQLTMGLALLIVKLKVLAIRLGNGLLGATMTGNYPYWLRSTIDPSFSL
jgi:hypothetical protein